MQLHKYSNWTMNILLFPFRFYRNIFDVKQFCDTFSSKVFAICIFKITADSFSKWSNGPYIAVYWHQLQWILPFSSKNNRPMLITFFCWFEWFNIFFMFLVIFSLCAWSSMYLLRPSHFVYASDFFCSVWHLCGVAVINSFLRIYFPLPSIVSINNLKCRSLWLLSLFDMFGLFILHCTLHQTLKKTQICLMLCSSVENRVKWSEIHEATGLFFLFIAHHLYSDLIPTDK